MVRALHIIVWWSAMSGLLGYVIAYSVRHRLWE